MLFAEESLMRLGFYARHPLHLLLTSRSQRPGFPSWLEGEPGRSFCRAPVVIKVSEHGLGLYYRPKEGRDSDCEVALWIKEGWQWILNRALGVSSQEPDWFSVPVMRRIAISTPNVMAALPRLHREQSRPYKVA